MVFAIGSRRDTMNKLEVIDKIKEILRNHCEDPAEEIMKMGTAMTEIGKALKGKSYAESRAIIDSVQLLTEVE
jgi:hypothetical protein